MIAAVLAGAGAFVTGGVTQTLGFVARSIAELVNPKPPLNIVVERVVDCPLSYVIPNASIEGVPIPPSVDQDLDRRDQWASQLNAIDGTTTLLKVTVTGTSGKAVVLQDLQIDVQERKVPIRGIEVHAVCGDALQARFITVNLDKRPPVIESTSDYRYLASEGGPPEDPIDFPYQVNESEAEVFYVIAKTETCDCKWQLVLNWVSGDDNGKVAIDDNGKPLRTRSVNGLPTYTSTYGEPFIHPSTQNGLGVIAYSESTAIAAVGFGASIDKAAEAAFDQCRTQGGALDCTAHMWFQNAFGALALGSNGAWGIAWAANAQYADMSALQACEQRGDNCQLWFRAQTPDIANESAFPNGGFPPTEPVSVPNLVGLSLADAQWALPEGLELGTVSSTEGTVVDQQPKPGDQAVPRYTKVDVVLSAPRSFPAELAGLAVFALLSVSLVLAARLLRHRIKHRR